MNKQPKLPPRKSNYLHPLLTLTALGRADGAILRGSCHTFDVYHDDWCDLLNGRGPCNCTPTIRRREQGIN